MKKTLFAVLLAAVAAASCGCNEKVGDSSSANVTVESQTEAATELETYAPLATVRARNIEEAGDFDYERYEGMIVGASPKVEDLVVNVCKKKHLTNTRASGSDDALRLVPPRVLSLEDCLEFLADDELLEVTPESLRIRKRILSNQQRAKIRGNAAKNQ